MTSLCEVVLDHTASGEPLGADEQAHAARCVDCARLARVPGLLGAVAHDVEPTPGFAARVQVGARRRLAVRRRNRMALVSFAAAAVLAAGGLAVTRPTHPVADPGAMTSLGEREPRPRPPVVAAEPAISDDQLVLDLVRVSHPDRALAGEAEWSDITRDLVPYRALLAKQGARQGAPR